MTLRFALFYQKSRALTFNTLFTLKTGSLFVEQQKPGSRIGTGSEPALELPWWKRSVSHHFPLSTALMKKSYGYNPALS